MKVKEESEKPALKLNIQKTKIMASSPITSWWIDGETVSDFIFLGSKINADSDWSHKTKQTNKQTKTTKKKPLAPWKKSYDKPRQYIKKQRHYSADKDPYSQSYGFSSNQVRMWELNHKEGWVLKNWCFFKL